MELSQGNRNSMAYLKSMINREQIIRLGEYFTIGSDISCNYNIQEPCVSARHARIERKDTSYFIKDLRSEFGTYVNGTKIVEAELLESDVVRFGLCEFQFTSSIVEQSKDFALTSKNEAWSGQLQTLASAAKTDFPILLLGPSGTGKDVLAQAIHQASGLKGPFISVNCSALTETLIESELFGHVKGSFTGAISDRKGAFEAARGGTLFLDEIGDLSFSLQAKLLRALENSEIRPVGSDKIINSNVRIVAATHQNLQEKITHNTFRSDLYFRLNVIAVSPPALADRMEDFEDLLYTFAKERRVRFSYNSILHLKNHNWPGNIRELKNLVSRASALFPRMQISENMIEQLIDKQTANRSVQNAREQNACTLSIIKEIEMQMIVKRLSVNKGNQRRTAQDLRMPKSTLHDRIKQLNIDLERFKT